MADSDVQSSALGSFLNGLVSGFFNSALGFLKFLLSMLDFGIAIVVTIIVATIHIAPLIYALFLQAVNLVMHSALPDNPADLPGAEWLTFSNEFFPVQELFSALAAYFTLKFALFTVRVCVGVGTFGWKVTIAVLQAIKFW